MFTIFILPSSLSQIGGSSALSSLWLRRNPRFIFLSFFFLSRFRRLFALSIRLCSFPDSAFFGLFVPGPMRRSLSLRSHPPGGTGIFLILSCAGVAGVCTSSLVSQRTCGVLC